MSAHNPPLLIVGMSRSGTTVVADILSAARRVHMEMEPHLLWKAGDFAELGDEDHPRSADALNWVRTQLLQKAGARTLVEKSPPNCLRPYTVNEVFPEARVIYVVREPLACLYSNYVRSRRAKALAPTVAARKYLLPSGIGQALAFTHDRQAVGGRRVWQQVRSREVGDFARYAQRLWRLKRRLGYLPFGPKLDAFSDVIAAADLLGYHLRCLVRAWEQAHVFRELFRQRIRVVRLEDLSRDPLEFIDSLLEFGGLEVDLGMRQEIVRELKSRKDAAPVPAWFQREFHDARFAPWRDRLDRAMRGL